MRGFCVAGELDLLRGWQLENFLDTLADVGKSLTSLLRSAALASGHITISAIGDALAGGTGPDTNTVEGFTDVDNHAHDFTVLLILKRVANGSKHYVQPQLIDIDTALVFELVRPLSTVFILGVLPLWSHASFEEVVIRLEGEVGDRCNVVLRALGQHQR